MGDATVKSVMPDKMQITVEGLSFRYEGPGSPWVIEDLEPADPGRKNHCHRRRERLGQNNLAEASDGILPRRQKDTIMIDGRKLEEISIRSLRKATGVVMQEGYIFPDTILGKYCPGNGQP